MSYYLRVLVIFFSYILFFFSPENAHSLPSSIPLNIIVVIVMIISVFIMSLVFWWPKTWSCWFMSSLRQAVLVLIFLSCDILFPTRQSTVRGGRCDHPPRCVQARICIDNNMHLRWKAFHSGFLAGCIVAQQGVPHSTTPHITQSVGLLHQPEQSFLREIKSFTV